jgi:hypothetical protein
MNMLNSLFNILPLYQTKSSKSTSFGIRVHLNWSLGKIKPINDAESFTDTVLQDSCCCVLPVLTCILEIGILFWIGSQQFFTRLSWFL